MIVHANIYDPTALSIFKSKASDRAECQTIACSNHENCELLSGGTCAVRMGISYSYCPYGKWGREVGYTRRAKSFYGWIKERRDRYEGISFLESPPAKVARVGDYVYLSYQFMGMIENDDLGARFISRDKFTVDFVKSLCEFRPRAYYGNELVEYQRDVVPLFVVHLKEVMPEVYDKLSEVYPRASELLSEHTNVGRKALLSTVVPNVGVLTGIHNDDWVWDGEYLTMTNGTASFVLVSHSEVRIKPVDGVAVEIRSDNQVNGDTVFVD